MKEKCLKRISHHLPTEVARMTTLISVRTFSLNKDQRKGAREGSRKKRGKGERKRWEKPPILKEFSRSKEFYSQRTLSPGVTTISLRNPEKSLQTGNQFCPLKEEEEQFGLQKRDTWTEKWRPRHATGGTALCRPGRLTGPQCPPCSPRHVFHSLAQKSASAVMRHKLFDNNMTQLIRTRPQNVCLWGPANFAMCLRG